MWVLKGRPRCVQCEPSCWFDWRVGKVQLQGFAFTWAGEQTVKWSDLKMKQRRLRIEKRKEKTHPTWGQNDQWVKTAQTITWGERTDEGTFIQNALKSGKKWISCFAHNFCITIYGQLTKYSQSMLSRLIFLWICSQISRLIFKFSYCQQLPNQQWAPPTNKCVVLMCFSSEPLSSTVSKSY